MKVIIVGTGAGGATAARELALKGFEVLMLEAGGELNPSPEGCPGLNPCAEWVFWVVKKISLEFFLQWIFCVPVKI